MLFCLLVCLFACLFVCLFVCLFIHLAACLRPWSFVKHCLSSSKHGNWTCFFWPCFCEQKLQPDVGRSLLIFHWHCNQFSRLQICPLYIFGNKATDGTYGSKYWCNQGLALIQGQIYNPDFGSLFSTRLHGLAVFLPCRFSQSIPPKKLTLTLRFRPLR